MALIIVFVVLYGLTQYFYSLQPDWLDCLFNPVFCAQYSVLGPIVGVVSVVASPLSIVVLVVIYAVRRHRARKK